MAEAGLHPSSKSPESLLFASFRLGMTLGIPEVPPNHQRSVRESCANIGVGGVCSNGTLVLVVSIAMEPWVTFTACPGTFVCFLASGICFLASRGIAFSFF